jgi:protein SCO1/2
LKPALVLVALLSLAGCAARPELPVYGQIPAFQLIDQTGRSFDRTALDGRIWVADFIFTTCTGPCPRMSSLMRQVQSAAAGVPNVRLVSFSVDPERDTPPVLAQYAQRYRAEEGRWFFLTGARQTLDALDRDAFKLGNVDGSLNHSTRFVLVDRRGRIRGYYGTSDESPVTAVLRDIKRLAAEKS